MRKRIIRGLLVLSLAFGGFAALQVQQAPSAAAAEMASDEGTLSQFQSGDVAWFKVAAERDSNTLKWRTVVTVWCTNSSGADVDCGLIEGTNVETSLQKNGAQVQLRTNWLDAADTHIKRFEHAWECEGTSLGNYWATGLNLQVRSRFGEQGTAKNRSTLGSGAAGSCSTA